MVNSYKRHKFAGMTRQYDIKDLVESIRDGGQLVPAVLWFDGNDWVLVDGFHRKLACNELAIELKVTKLPEETMEYELPRKILDIQLLNKMAGKIQGNCEAIVYLDMVKEFPRSEKMTQKKLCESYSLLDKNSIDRLKKLKGLNLDWFNILRSGEKVNIGTVDEPYWTDSALKLNQVMLQRLKEDEDKEPASDVGYELDDDELNQRSAVFYDKVRDTIRSWTRSEGTEVLKSFYSRELNKINRGEYDED